MGSNRIELPIKRSIELANSVFPFTSQLTGVETINSSNATAVVYSGNEIVPTLTLSNFASLTAVTVTIGGGTPGIIYELTITATSNVGNIYAQRALLAIAPNPE